MNLTVKKVDKNLKEYSKIKKLMVKTFPKNERIPFWLLNLYTANDNVEFLAYYDSNNIVGITYTINYENTAFLLYLVVFDKLRNKGYGKELLNSLKENKYIVLNAEKPSINKDNIEQRKKRINFYLKNGFLNTKYELVEKDETYTILSTNKKFSEKQYDDLLKNISFGIYNGIIRKRLMNNCG